MYDYSRPPQAARPRRQRVSRRGGRAACGSGSDRRRAGRRTHARHPRAHGREHGLRWRRRTSKLRALNAQPTTPGTREEVYCTKIGSTHPNEMYIVGAHMDGHGWGEAANDDGSGTALVMELARIFSMPDVEDRRSIRFVLWNNEETGPQRRSRLRRAARSLQGKEYASRIGQVPGAEVAGHDPARHDDVRPRHAARRRTSAPSSAPRRT